MNVNSFVAMGALLLAAPTLAATPPASGDGGVSTASLPAVTVAAVSISAVDAERTADFYKAVFGMQEVRRIDARPNFLEIVMKPGKAPEAARAQEGPALIVISRQEGTSSEFPSVKGWARSHVVLVVPDIAPVLERTKANGGLVEIAPYTSKGSLQSETDTHPSQSGSHVDSMIRDPGGNYVELLSLR